MEYNDPAMILCLQDACRESGLVVEGDETIDELTEAVYYLAEYHTVQWAARVAA